MRIMPISEKMSNFRQFLTLAPLFLQRSREEKGNAPCRLGAVNYGEG